jgi:hypothetical protein
MPQHLLGTNPYIPKGDQPSAEKSTNDIVTAITEYFNMLEKEISGAFNCVRL